VDVLLEIELNVRLFEFGVAISPNKFLAAFRSNDEFFVVVEVEDMLVVFGIGDVFCVGGGVGYTINVSFVGVVSLNLIKKIKKVQILVIKLIFNSNIVYFCL
jgi:hypothetical protein